MVTVRLNLNSHQVRRRLADVPRMLSGRIPDTQGGELARAFALRLGVTCMAFLKEAYVTKARGGVDAAGERWKPLAPATIERRMAKGKNLKLTRRQYRAYDRMKQAEYALRKAIEKLGQSKSARDWYKNAERRGELKRDLSRARERHREALRQYQAAMAGLEILRDTGRLYNSLSPGLTGTLRNGGVLEVRPGVIVFGTNVAYAARHHHGDGRCPQRRLWPEPRLWPAQWWGLLRRSAATGLARMVELELRRAA